MGGNTNPSFHNKKKGYNSPQYLRLQGETKAEASAQMAGWPRLNPPYESALALRSVP
jgi:hypothetical protein